MKFLLLTLAVVTSATLFPSIGGSIQATTFQNGLRNRSSIIINSSRWNRDISAGTWQNGVGKISYTNI